MLNFYTLNYDDEMPSLNTQSQNGKYLHTSSLSVLISSSLYTTLFCLFRFIFFFFFILFILFVLIMTKLVSICGL